jgi:O-antigen ligase
VQPSSGTWINPDRFSGFLEMVLPLAVTGAFAAWRSGVLPHEASGGKALKAAAALTVAVTCLSGIVVSLSRAGFSGAIVSLAVLLLIALFAPGARLASAGIPVTRRITAGLAAIAATSAAFLFLPTDELIARFGLAVASSQSLSGETRLELWRDTRKLIAAYPLTGSGLGTYESALMRFKTAAPMRTADYAHNDYLQAAAELGIAGAAIGLIWIALVFARTLRASTSPVPGSPNRYLALGLAGSMVAILIHSLVDFNLYMPAEAMVFAWICGLAASSPLRAQASVTSTAAVRVIQSTSLQ